MMPHADTWFVGGTARAVPSTQVFRWFEEAMRLFKRAPLIWCALGVITLASDFVLSALPGVGVAAAKVISPVVECGLLIGAAALDRNQSLRVRHALAAFSAPPGALAAIVVSSLLVLAAESATAYALADVNLLSSATDEESLSSSVQLALLTVGTATTLPVAFVPFAALFEGAGFLRAFNRSIDGFLLNIGPLLLFGACALVLVLLGLLSFGILLIAVLPLISTATYAAWKDIYAVRMTTTAPPQP